MQTPEVGTTFILQAYFKLQPAAYNALPTELRSQVGSSMWYFGTESSNHDFFCVGVMYSGEYDAYTKKTQQISILFTTINIFVWTEK